MSKSSYESGLEAEAIAISHFQKIGFYLLRQRWRSPFAEIDLLFKAKDSAQHLLLVEVKKRSSLEFRSFAMSRRQKRRLQKSILWLAEQGYLVEAQLCFVDKNGQIESLTQVFG